MENIEISAVIIDDDIEAIDLLELYLRGFPQIKLVGKSCDAVSGIELISEQVPDLIFLDIDMPGMTGLELAELLKNERVRSEIVFTTAFQDYAYKALGVEPLDFLTKPFSSDDLEIVISKYIGKSERKTREQKLNKFFQSQLTVPKISISSISGVLVIDPREIVLIRSSSHKCEIYLQDGTIEEINKGLTKLMAVLDSSSLFQINRSTLVNLNYLQRIDKKKKICFIKFNGSVCEEYIGKGNIANFEKLNFYPSI
jgi:two-component system LytT family response regulator